MRTMIPTGMLGALLMLGAGGSAMARKPAQNVSGQRHPNIAAAQRLSANAFEKLSAAQSANEFDMQGHAAKAKQLLQEANDEMKLAAEAANANR